MIILGGSPPKKFGNPCSTVCMVLDSPNMEIPDVINIKSILGMPIYGHIVVPRHFTSNKDLLRGELVDLFSTCNMQV